MRITSRSTLILLSAILICSCSKKKVENADSFTIIDRIVGPHTWTGVEHSRSKNFFGDTTTHDTTYQVSFDCPINKISETTIYFEKNAPLTEEMSMQSFDFSSHIVTFYACYTTTMNKIVAISTITYNFQTDTLTLITDETFSPGRGYAKSRLEAYSLLTR